MVLEERHVGQGEMAMQEAQRHMLQGKMVIEKEQGDRSNDGIRRRTTTHRSNDDGD